MLLKEKKSANSTRAMLITTGSGFQAYSQFDSAFDVES